MISFKKDIIRPIGLDIGYGSIKMIQLGQSEKGLYVLAADEVRFDPEIASDKIKRRQFTISSIKEMLSNGQFKNRNVVSCLQNDELKIKSLRLDVAQTEIIDELIRTEIAQKLGLHAEKDEIRYMIAGNVFQGEEIKNEVIFFGSESEVVGEKISLLEEAGLDPEGLDPVPCALYRAFQGTFRRQEDQSMVSVFVEVGSHSTTVVIGRGQEIAFIKQIPIGGEILNDQVARKLGVSINEAVILRDKLRNESDREIEIDSSTRQSVIDAMSETIEDLAKEVSLCFRYYAVTFRGERPQEVYFAGGEAKEMTLINALKRHLGVEIKIAHPLRGFDMSRFTISSDNPSELCQWAIAVGLSMKGWDLSVCGA